IAVSIAVICGGTGMKWGQQSATVDEAVQTLACDSYSHAAIEKTVKLFWHAFDIQLLFDRPVPLVRLLSPRHVPGACCLLLWNRAAMVYGAWHGSQFVGF
ncbi:MAG: hypothetical protein ACKPKO_36415, partial [Candidatus Fonsibacter sp.]